MNTIWRQAYNFRLRPNSVQQIILIQLCGSAKYAWNQVLSGRNEEYNEYIEDVESVQSRGKDVSLVPKPKPINRFLFTYDLKKMIEEEDYSFLKTQGHSQVPQQNNQDLHRVFSRIFKGKGAILNSRPKTAIILLDFLRV